MNSESEEGYFILATLLSRSEQGFYEDDVFVEYGL